MYSFLLFSKRFQGLQRPFLGERVLEREVVSALCMGCVIPKDFQLHFFLFVSLVEMSTSVCFAT